MCKNANKIDKIKPPEGKFLVITGHHSHLIQIIKSSKELYVYGYIARRQN